MKILFLCPACERLTAFCDFRIEGDALLLRCSRCRVESRTQAAEAAPRAGSVAAAASASAGAPGKAARAVIPTGADLASDGGLPSVPEGHCPKCVAVRTPQASSCSQCGLVFSNYQPEELAPSSELAEHFRQLLSSWDDVEEHDRVIQSALAQGELAVLGRLYRIQLARSADDAFAARGRDEVLRLAAASSAGLVRDEAVVVSRFRAVVLAAGLLGLLFFVAIVLYTVLRRYVGS